MTPADFEQWPRTSADAMAQDELFITGYHVHVPKVNQHDECFLCHGPFAAEEGGICKVCANLEEE